MSPPAKPQRPFTQLALPFATYSFDDVSERSPVVAELPLPPWAMEPQAPPARPRKGRK